DYWSSTFATFDNRFAVTDFVNYIFRKVMSNIKAVEFESNKSRILVHAGSLIPNGITTAVINLLSKIDYDKYDVTVVYPYSSKSYQVKKASEIDERARILPRVGNVSMCWMHRRAYWAYTKGGR